MVFLCSSRWQPFQNIVKENVKLSQLKWYILMGSLILILNYLSTIWRFLYLILRVQLASPWRLRRYCNFCYIMSHSWFMKPKCVIQDGGDGFFVWMCLFVKIYGWGWWHFIVSLLFFMFLFVWSWYVLPICSLYLFIFCLILVFVIPFPSLFYWTA